MTSLYAFNNTQCEAVAQFDTLHWQAQRHKFWATLTGRATRCSICWSAKRQIRCGHAITAVCNLVALTQICGSEGHWADFDATFRPLQAHTHTR